MAIAPSVEIIVADVLGIRREFDRPVEYVARILLEVDGVRRIDAEWGDDPDSVRPILAARVEAKYGISAAKVLNAIEAEERRKQERIGA